MLRAEKLTKKFGDQVALDRLDLSIAPGEVFCLLGANGAGKTTAIHLFLGFLEPTSGAAYVADREVAKNVAASRRELAYVPERVELYPLLSGLENLAYFMRLSGRTPVQEAELLEHLAEVGLDRRAAQMRLERYSKGMRQKVGLAIAIAKGARALLLDEPLSGLDPQAAHELSALIRRLADRGAAALIVTHDLFRAQEVADHIGIMKAGRLVEALQAGELGRRQLEHVYLEHMRAEAT